MNQEAVLALTTHAIVITLMLAAPVLLLSLVVGLIVSIFQAVTQINEMTLSFIPKVITVALTLVVFGPWMLNMLVSYTQTVFSQAGILAR